MNCCPTYQSIVLMKAVFLVCTPLLLYGMQTEASFLWLG